MKKLLSRKNWLTILVVALNFILFIRSTQYEAVFTPVSLLTGPIVIILALSFVPIKKILNLYSFFCSFICIIAIIVFLVLYKQAIICFPVYNGIALIINAWTIGTGIIYIVQEVVQKHIKIRISALAIMWILFTILVIVGNSDKWWPIWFFIVFGVYYLIPFENEDMQVLSDSIVNGTIIGFIAIQGFAYLFRPFDEIRYRGAFYNTNDMGIYYSTVYLMVLVKIYSLKRKRTKNIIVFLWTFLAASLVSFQLFTSCRTAWIASLGVTIVYIFFVMKFYDKEPIKKIVIRGSIFLLLIVISFPMVYASIRYLPCVHPHPVWYWDEWSEDKVHSWDPIDSDKYTSFGETTKKLYSQIIRFVGKKNDSNDLNVSKTEDNEASNMSRNITYEEIEKSNENNRTIVIVEPFSNKKIDRLFSNRITYFKGYLVNSTWFGRSESRYELYSRVYEDDEVRYHRLWHAQNVWIQIIWNFGYMAGGIAIVMSLICMYNRFRFAKLFDKIFYLLALLVSVEYFLVGTMEIVWLPGQLILTLLFLTQKQSNELQMR